MTTREEPRIAAQPLIAVRDLPASTRWYTKLLALRHDHPPEHRVYQGLWDGERLVMQLHGWNLEDHPNLVEPDRAPVGHGVLLWFAVDDFDASLARVHESGAEVVVEPHLNPNAQQHEVWLRDPDGYVIVIAGPRG